MAKIKIRAEQKIWDTRLNLDPMNFRCSKCGKDRAHGDFHEKHSQDRKRPVTSQCRECRSEVYYEKRYPDSICAQCLKHRPLNKNGVCFECNTAAGLRQCRECKDLLPLYLKFLENEVVCRDCRAKLRRLRRQRRGLSGGSGGPSRGRGLGSGSRLS